jgi:hypothetical protein
MRKMIMATASAISILAVGHPAFAFGPTGLGRDLMYTSAIGHSSETPLTTRAGFVRPNIPYGLSTYGQVQGEGIELKAYSNQFVTAVGFVLDGIWNTAEHSSIAIVRVQ